MLKRRFRRKKSGFSAQRRDGWGMDLYRDRATGWIGGVCAGLSDYSGIPNWMTRIAAVLMFFITGSLAFWGYVAGVILMAPRASAYSDDDGSESDQKKPEKRYKGAPSANLRKAQVAMDKALARVEVMESYVTSRRYDLNQKFSRL